MFSRGAAIYPFLFHLFPLLIVKDIPRLGNKGILPDGIGFIQSWHHELDPTIESVPNPRTRTASYHRGVPSSDKKPIATEPPTRDCGGGHTAESERPLGRSNMANFRRIGNSNRHDPIRRPAAAAIVTTVDAIPRGQAKMLAGARKLESWGKLALASGINSVQPINETQVSVRNHTRRHLRKMNLSRDVQHCERRL